MDKNEYIKASDLYEFRSELMDMFIYLCNANDFNRLTLLTIAETIDKIYGKYDSRPLADVEEVKHGEWKIKTDDYDCQYMMCSCCKEEFYPVDEDTVDTTPNYCPNCGAKMDGGKKE